MGRRGWVSAEVEPDVWKRLSVFDDGWTELSGFARTFSDTRNQMRTTLVTIAVVLAILFSLPFLNMVPFVPAQVSTPLSLAGFFVAIFLVFRLRTRTRTVNAAQIAADAEQARRERAAGEQIRRAPGAPLFRRANSAAQFAEWMEGEVYVEATRVYRVTSVEEDSDHIVSVEFDDGTVRTYRSPDRTLPRLLLPFSRG